MNSHERALADLAKAIGDLSRESHVRITVDISPLPPGFSGERGDAAIRFEGGTVNVVQTNVTNISNTGTAGVIAGGNANHASANVSRAHNASPADLAHLLQPFADALAASGLSAAKQGLVKAQLDVMREQAAKPNVERNQNDIKRALDDVKAAAGAAASLKSLWDQFGDGISGWFAGSAC